MSKRKIKVGIIRADTGSNQATDLPSRYKLIEDAADELATKTSADSCDFGLLVAPEYFFAKNAIPFVKPASMDAIEERQLSDPQRREIEKKIAEISTKVGAPLVLIPGTIAWKKALRGWESFNAYKKWKHFRGEVGGEAWVDDGSEERASELDIHWTYKEKRGAKAEQALVDNIAKLGSGTGKTILSNNPKLATKTFGAKLFGSLGLAETYNSLGGETWTYTDGLKARSLETDRSSLKSATWMSRNTALIYRNGERLLKYHKTTGYHEVINHQDENIFISDLDRSPCFEVDGVKFAIEICLENVHQDKLTKHMDYKSPHVHILLSASIGNPKPLEDVQFLIQADSHRAFIEDDKKTAVLNEATPKSTWPSDLKVAEIEVDI